MTRARVCARGCVWVRVCEAGRTVGLPGVWVCGCAACVRGCTCVNVWCDAGEAAQTWTTSARLVGSAAMAGSTTTTQKETKVLL